MLIAGTAIAAGHELGPPSGTPQADLGYEGEADILRIPIKEPAGGELGPDQQAYNAVRRPALPG
jgi:hypothetical protein